MDSSSLKEGDAILLVQRRFTLPEPAIFIRYYPRGSDQITETAVFLRTGTVCPVSEWANFQSTDSIDRGEYENIVKSWAKVKPSRKALVRVLLEFFDEIKDYDNWREQWILSGKLYRRYDHSSIFDEDDPRRSSVVSSVQPEIFSDSADLVVGLMDRIQDPGIQGACAEGPHAILRLVMGNKWFSNECGGKRVIETFAKDFNDAFEGKQEGQWVNLVVKEKALAAFGLPQGFLKSAGHMKFPVPNYDQLILQCDGEDKARTLGMHRDVFPGSSATHVSTILGCVGGLGKEMLVWRGHTNAVPAWWRQEGLPCELFDYVYKNTDSSLLQRVVIKPGQFVFMPRGLWHWVRPIPGAKWTVMVTSSFHTSGADFDSEAVRSNPSPVSTPDTRKRKTVPSTSPGNREQPARKRKAVK